MDKDVMKRLLRDAQIPVPKFLAFKRAAQDEIDFASVKRTLGVPLFVKPANLGSSVGISKVLNKHQFAGAIKEAFRYDNKIVLEEGIQGREIECSVLGNEHPIASLPGEIITRHDFYSYDAKYLDEKGARLVVPADLPRRWIFSCAKGARFWLMRSIPYQASRRSACIPSCGKSAGSLIPLSSTA
jgi:D-alanine-D-alanine ligase